MAQILVRDVDPGVLGRLKARARQHQRSLQGEVKMILIEAVDLTLREAYAVSEQWQKRLAGGVFNDSADLIRKDRKR